MPASLALLLWFILIFSLFYFDPARERKTSAALWVPVVWLFFLGSRPPAMWLGLDVGHGAEALEQGNPVDRTVYLFLILLAIGILASRRTFRWGAFVTQNSAVALFLAFSFVSVAWSDFPLATFKKWFRDVGVYMAVLVVLSDPNPVEAVRTVLRRVCYLFVPLSILLIKYYPHLGKSYSPWGGQEYGGVSTSKNMLGVVCLVSGIVFFWDTILRWRQRSTERVRRVILVNSAFMIMSLWLLDLSDSLTSTICLVIGCLVIAAAHCRLGRRHPGLLKAVAPMSFLVYLIVTVGFGMGAQLSEAVGRDGTMSDRTRIWQVLLSVPINPVLGTGYQSFWLGSRVDWVWARLSGDNVLQAHNGYLQTYLELGIIGLLLMCAILMATYRNVCKRLQPLNPFGSLGLGVWTLLLFYNVTEAAFGPSLLFVTFLMAGLRIPRHARHQTHALRSSAIGDATEQVTNISVEVRSR